MALPPGTRLGAYEITAPLGAGGMGEVYRARDSKLKREVAIKVLPADVANDRERLARFQREAEVLASLNHPHIAHVYGVEENALVMELVDGEDLSQRISRGPIPIDEALPIAKQIAEALEAAHEAGIVHRDLKPANVKIRPDGTVKVLDFGLAKSSQRSGIGDQGSGSLANSPTITSPAMTMHGVILGTAAYMAPEQAKGRAVDRRADIWAFGCVLFEMLTGARAFDGEDTTEILGAIVKSEPDWSALSPSMPYPITALIKRCVQKDLRKRQQHIGDARLELDEALTRAPGNVASPAIGVRTGYLPWSIAAVLATALVTAAVMGWPWPQESPAVFPMRVDIVTPPLSTPIQVLNFALSPDGRRLAFLAGVQSAPISIRSIETGETRELPGTNGAAQLFWSPDGRSIGFVLGTKLMRLDLDAAAPVTIADVALPGGADWHTDGTILYVPTYGPVLRVSASGGTPTPLTTLADGETLHAAPRMLPDGEHYLYLAASFRTTSSTAKVELFLGSLKGGPARRVATQLSQAAVNYEVLPANWLLSWFDGELRAQQLDIDRAALVGEPVRVASGVISRPSEFQAAFHAADTGVIAYRTSDVTRQLAWFDRAGRVLELVGKPDSDQLVAATVSPDGTRIALDRGVAGNRDVWMRDVARGTVSRITSHASDEGTPIWSPDGTRIAFESRRDGRFQLYVMPATGSGPEERLQESTHDQWPLDWSRDGRFLLYIDSTTFLNGDLFALPLTGADRTPIPIATTTFSEMTGSFSPDGRWVAYQTARSGREEVVVQSFPNPSQSMQISSAGGRTPRWSAGGNELFFVAPDGMLMVASIAATTTGVKAGTPSVLFQTGLGDYAGIRQFDIDRNGRFLMDMGNQSAPPIRLLLNWKPGVSP